MRLVGNIVGYSASSYDTMAQIAGLSRHGSHAMNNTAGLSSGPCAAL